MSASMSRTNIMYLIKNFNSTKWHQRQLAKYHTSSINADQSFKQKQLLDEKRKEHMSRGLPKRKPLKGVKQVLIVASGKGGVGKSTTAVNLSAALKLIEPEKSIGLLDADIFGPSVPSMMNIHETPVVNKENLMEPLVNYNIKCMSMGFLIDDKSPIVWRGLMVMSALEKLLYGVAWNPLDYLIIDTPPGTGDTHLSLIQNITVTAALLVTTADKMAIEVTRRGANMFRKTNVPICGIVENMSNVVCPKCTTEIPLFSGHTETLAKELGTNIIQKVPLHAEVTKSCDIGKPVVLSAPNSPESEAYQKLARNVIQFLSYQPCNNE